MESYENLQKMSYALIAIMLVFYFVESLVIYKQELTTDDEGGLELNYRLEEIRWEVPDTDMDGSRDISYDYIAFEEIEKVMQNMKNIALLLILASAFLIWYPALWVSAKVLISRKLLMFCPKTTGTPTAQASRIL